MRISTKCSVALHILTLLEVFTEGKLTSEILAGSTGSNPVIIRNILGDLKRAGIVEVQRGVGGARLCKAPEDITVWMVYSAVNEAPLDEIIGKHPSPSPECPVGRNIYALLERPYGEITNAMHAAMEQRTLGQIIEEYRQLTAETTTAE